MNTYSSSDEFNISVMKHYQASFSNTWHPAKFPVMLVIPPIMGSVKNTVRRDIGAFNENHQWRPGEY